MNQLTVPQWKKIIDNGLVLRCDTTDTTCSSPAVFQMNDDNELTTKGYPPKPSDWEEKLKTTIRFMMTQGDYSKNYLQIGDNVISSSKERYIYDKKQTFPKVSVVYRNLIAAKSMEKQTPDSLADWVIENI